MTDDLMAWLGPAADDLTPEQIDRVQTAAADIADRYPDPDDQPDREAALSATVQYLLDDIAPEDAATALVEARRREREAYVAALQVALLVVHDGEAKATAARRCGVDRQSLLRALCDR